MEEKNPRRNLSEPWNLVRRLQHRLVLPTVRKIEGTDAPLAQSMSYEKAARHIDFLGRHEVRLDRMAREARKQLILLQDRRKKATAPPPPDSGRANHPGEHRTMSLLETTRYRADQSLLEHMRLAQALPDVPAAANPQQSATSAPSQPPIRGRPRAPDSL